jgi:hypothetical protein
MTQMFPAGRIAKMAVFQEPLSGPGLLWFSFRSLLGDACGRRGAFWVIKSQQELSLKNQAERNQASIGALLG